MPPLSLQSGVRYAKTLLPETLVRSVSTVQTTISRHILPSVQLQPRSFSAARAFVLSCQFLTLVLEEDGTVVDSNDFFQCLPSNTPLMVLEKGEMWTENKILPSFRQPKRNAIAKLTLDLYKLHPKDLLCCFGIKATLYDMYTLSYDFRCTTMKQVLRSTLRCLTYLTRLLGQLLLYTSSSLLQFTGEDER